MVGTVAHLGPAAPCPPKVMFEGKRLCPSLLRRIFKHNADGTQKRVANAFRVAVRTAKEWLRWGVPKRKRAALLAAIDQEQASIREHLAELESLKAALRSEIE